MNILQNRRVVLGIVIWFAFAALAGALYLPPTYKPTQRTVAVAPADAKAPATTDSVTATLSAGEAPSGTVAVAAVAASVRTDPVVAASDSPTESIATTVEAVSAVTDTVTTELTVTDPVLTDTVTTETVTADPVVTATVTTESIATTSAAPAPVADTIDPALIAVGENVFQHTAGGVGCQLCHGQDAKGLIGPNIVGKTADDIRFQFENNSRMKFITLTEQEVEAVAIYLQYLANPAAFVMPGDSGSGETASTTASQSPTDPVLAGGQEIFQKTAGGVGCQLCHGPDAKGLIGPSIVGKTADDIRTQFETNDQMKFIVLNNQEIEAVATYLQYLADPNAAVLTTGGAAQSEAGAAAPAIDDPAVAEGEDLFQITAGGVGCQLCHGQDAKGLIGPNIVGKTAADIRFQFENNDQMKFITLTDQEIDSVAAYLQYLATK